MPEMVVLAPVDSVECEAAMRWATAYNGPVYLRLARDICPDVFEPSYEFVLGRTIQLKEGTDVLLVSTGPQTYRCKEAADLLAKEGISAGVLHVPSIKPINADELVKACEGVRIVVTVEEHSIYGGLGGLVAEILSEQSPRRVVRVGIEDRWGESAPNEFLLDLFHLSPARLSELVKSKLREAS
jgi:transketolase